MNVSIMTMWYNEENFAHFFLRHYSWVDKIHLLLDADTNDETEKIVKGYNNVEIEKFQFPDGMDDELKINKFNDLYKNIDSDWVILVDSDEFIFTQNLNTNLKPYLEQRLEKNILFSRLWNVYRHVSESDLDINKSVMEQRRHGILNLSSCPGVPYTKPNIIRGRLENVCWTPGHHYVNINGIQIGENIPNKPSWVDSAYLCGSHWAMADMNIAIKRRIYGRKLRQSKNNLTKGLTVQNHSITEEQIIQECLQYQNSPKVF